MKHTFLLFAVATFAACSQASSAPLAQTEASHNTVASAAQTTASAIFAGGCFWCVESDFEKLPGVIEAISGYTGGTTIDPTYKEVTYKQTGHYEAAKVIYDPSKITYEDLLSHFWTSVDPTDPHGQFCDKGESYRSAIFVTPEQLESATASKRAVESSKPFSDPIVTPILKAQTFYNAEDYHQDYYKKNPIRYKYYRNGCRRDARLKQLWGDNHKG